MTLEEIKQSYINSKSEVEVIEKKIALKNKQIDKLMLKKQKINDSNWWGDSIIRPIIELIKLKFPQTTKWDDDRLIPMGMKCRVSVFGKYREQTIGITFCPNDLSKGLISFENGMKGLHPYRDLNGFCYKDDIIIDIEQVYVYIQEQLVNIDSQLDTEKV